MRDKVIGFPNASHIGAYLLPARTIGRFRESLVTGRYLAFLTPHVFSSDKWCRYTAFCRLKEVKLKQI